MVKIGLIGCGAMGTEVAKAIFERLHEKAKLEFICDVDEMKADVLRASLGNEPKIVDIDKLIEKSDLIVETASSDISGQVAFDALKAGKDVLIISIGGLITDERWKEELGKTGARLYLPSGALAGIDALMAAGMEKIEDVILITRKPPEGLEGAPFIEENDIELSKIKKETMVFEGKAADAIRGFPKNINVCALLSLAALGPKKTKVRIYTSPSYKINSHELTVKTEFGKITAKSESKPSPRNPKTSHLAILSVIAALKRILGPLRIGT